MRLSALLAASLTALAASAHADVVWDTLSGEREPVAPVQLRERRPRNTVGERRHPGRAERRGERVEALHRRPAPPQRRRVSSPRRTPRGRATSSTPGRPRRRSSRAPFWATSGRAPARRASAPRRPSAARAFRFSGSTLTSEARSSFLREPASWASTPSRCPSTSEPSPGSTRRRALPLRRGC